MQVVDALMVTPKEIFNVIETDSADLTCLIFPYALNAVGLT
jgi:hypothetical protein